MATAPAPKRGEVWLVDFDPAVGAEIHKLRPALVVSVDTIGRLPLRLVVRSRIGSRSTQITPGLWKYALQCATGLPRIQALTPFRRNLSRLTGLFSDLEPRRRSN